MKKTKVKAKGNLKACAGCGAKIPKSAGKMIKGKFYCCEGCKD